MCACYARTRAYAHAHKHRRRPQKKNPQKKSSFVGRKKIYHSLPPVGLSLQRTKIIDMRKSAENIMALLHQGVAGLTLKSADFRFSELFEFARLAATSETNLVLIVGDNLTASEVLSLAEIAHGHLHVDLSL